MINTTKYFDTNVVFFVLTIHNLNIFVFFFHCLLGIWSYTWRAVKEYASKYGEVHVTTGPVYDYNTDGLSDRPLNNKTVYVV